MLFQSCRYLYKNDNVSILHSQSELQVHMYFFFYFQMWCRAILIGFLIGTAVSQSNYDNQANSIEYTGDGLPESTILDGKVTKLDDIAPIIFLNRTKAALNCAAGYMQVNEQ